jgi:hypothetical protein
LGKVLTVDIDDEDAHIAFMKEAKSVGNQGTRYKWPPAPKADEVWIPFTDILVEVEPPVPIGRSERFFEIPD